MFQTIRHLSDVDPGFDTQHVITFKVGVSQSLTKTAASTRVAYQQLIDRIRKIPGVLAADFTSAVPLSGRGWTMPFWIGSQQPASLQSAPRLVMYLTGPGLLSSHEDTAASGPSISLAADTTQSPCVMIIDTVFAHTYFSDSDPLLQTLSAGFSPMGPCRIVGVVGHVRHWVLEDPGTYTQVQAYLSLYQDPDKWVPVNYPGTTIVLRTPLDLETVMPAIKGAVYGGETDQTIYDVRTIAGNCLGIDVVAEIYHDFTQRVCWVGAAARFNRSLRRAFLFGGTAHKRDWHTHDSRR